MPVRFSHLSKNKVPSTAIIAITLGILIGFILDVIATSINKSIGSFFIVVYSSNVLPGIVP
ncbi:hypothetical protein [uncultured Lactobacillus sp.]|uniref:hypothetical protein n=1 Tax=uncultured Lactobacillus sp. TaxID=153152 RepID=UPI002608B081|nr:hypothetical protein [uncultured Lactobacillus sp.]